MPAKSFSTTNVDEANAIANEVFYESRVEPVRSSTTPFRFDMKADTVGALGFGVVSYGCEITADVGGLDMTYSVALPLRGTFPVQFGHKSVMADPSTAAVATPVSHVKWRGWFTGTERLFVMKFDKDLLETELRNLLGRDSIGSIPIAPSLDVRGGLGAQWWRMASTLALAVQSEEGLATNPMMTAHMSSPIMTGFLLATDHPYRDDLDAWVRPVPPATIRRAADIIETRAHEPLTISEIAAEIGCGVRALQLGYRKHLKMTPREHLGIVRMDRAHAMLRTASPASITVAAIAEMWGYRQPSRFAKDYRRLYGVSPSATLRDG